MRGYGLDGVTVAHAVAVSAAGLAAVLAANAGSAVAAACAGASSLLALLLVRNAPAVAPVMARPPPPREVPADTGEPDKLRHEIRQMTTMLDRELVQAMGDVVARTTRMSECAGDLRAMAADIRESSAVTADAVQVASAGVLTTAEAAGELSRSLEGVRSDVRRTGEMCHQAVERARNADRTVQSLSDATMHIGQVVGVIGTIARQTNMLAMNATIEAARAGEMGKGFAVVATEVKTLATGTARSTEDIARQVDHIRNAIDGAVGSIGAIVDVIDQLDAIAAAMEQTMSGHLALIEGIASRTGEAAASIHMAETHLQSALKVNDRVTDAAQEVDSEVEEVATRIKGFQKMTALVVKRGLRVVGEPTRQSPYRGIDFIIGNRRLPVDQVKVEAGSARFRTNEIIAGGSSVEVEIPVVGRIPAVVERVQDGLVELVFLIDDGVRASLAQWLGAREGAAE